VAVLPANWPGVDQTKAFVFFEFTFAIETQTSVDGLTGGSDDQPVGAVPELVVKLQEPPVGVAGWAEETWKTNHSK